MRRWGLAVFCFGLTVSAHAQGAPPITKPVPAGPLNCSDHGLDRYHGIARVKFRVDVDGTTRDIAIEKSSGNEELDQASIDCVAAWKYSPATQGDHPVVYDLDEQIDWNAPSEADLTERTSLAPDLAAMEPMIHRLGTDTHMGYSASNVLRLTTGNKAWRCRQVFFEIKGEHRVMHWLAQGWDDPNDLVYGRTEGDQYTAVHLRADGTFIAAISSSNDGGSELHYADVKALMEVEVAAWNESGRKN